MKRLVAAVLRVLEQTGLWASYEERMLDRNGEE